ncbi:MAG: FAD-dependent oxidoreductase [Lysobacteraceae bacterium]|nr:MAG: FAD-dependent oxidoreductase [Xanthomonadaceae bacterium]
MNRRLTTARGRGRADAAIVGGGVVGAACALALARHGLQVTLIEGAEPPAWRAQTHDLRVYAFAPDNASLLDRIGVWAQVREARAQPYRRMRVWDAAGGEELRFDADAMAAPQLGWIVEHGLLQDRLWAALRHSDVVLRCPSKVADLIQETDGVTLVLDDGLRVDARIAIAADGGNSTLRALAGIGTDEHDYAQRGVVAYVATERPHEDTAWQRFLPTGPLAFLPCLPRPDTAHVCSIVWTLPEAEALRVLALDDEAFANELGRAFASRLGEVRPLSPRTGFPLRSRLAQNFVSGRVLAIGDAAHVVHPLAGQGVNLGLRDVDALSDSVADAQRKRVDWSAPHRLARWARARRSDSVASAQAFTAINRAFSNDHLVATLLRGHALGLAGKLAPLNRALWRHAAGM